MGTYHRSLLMITLKSLRLTSSSLSIDGYPFSIPIDKSTPLYLISFGKASAAMTEAAEKVSENRKKKGMEGGGGGSFHS